MTNINILNNDRDIKMCIYLITCIVNDKKYIGQTVRNAGKRWTAHLCAKSGAGKSAIKCAIIKYGKDYFKFEILDIGENQLDLDEKEIYWINKFNSIAPNGYNLTYGGSGGKKISEETRAKMKASAKARFEREGRSVIPETEEERNIRRKAWALASKERLTGNTYRRGQIATPETIQKIKQSKIGNTNHNIKVIRSDGVIFESIKEAAKQTEISKHAILKNLNGKSKKMRCGFSFSYVSI